MQYAQPAMTVKVSGGQARDIYFRLSEIIVCEGQVVRIGREIAQVVVVLLSGIFRPHERRCSSEGDFFARCQNNSWHGQSGAFLPS